MIAKNHVYITTRAIDRFNEYIISPQSLVMVTSHVEHVFAICVYGHRGSPVIQWDTYHAFCEDTLPLVELTALSTQPEPVPSSDRIVTEKSQLVSR